MTALIQLHDRFFAWVQAKTHIILPTLARLIFAGVLFRYFWNSALTKLNGLFSPSLNAYAQIFPKAMEASGYDPSALSGLQTLIVLLGTYAEFVLPVLIVSGPVHTPRRRWHDRFCDCSIAHRRDRPWGRVAGAWFDGDAVSLILDQRAFWVFALIVLVIRGAGPFSLDACSGPQQSLNKA